MIQMTRVVHVVDVAGLVAGFDDDELAHHPLVLVLSRWQWNMYGVSGSA